MSNKMRVVKRCLESLDVVIIALSTPVDECDDDGLPSNHSNDQEDQVDSCIMPCSTESLQFEPGCDLELLPFQYECSASTSFHRAGSVHDLAPTRSTCFAPNSGHRCFRSHPSYPSPKRDTWCLIRLISPEPFPFHLQKHPRNQTFAEVNHLKHNALTNRPNGTDSSKLSPCQTKCDWPRDV
jgi:hypothetical protein